MKILMRTSARTIKATENQQNLLQKKYRASPLKESPRDMCVTACPRPCLSQPFGVVCTPASSVKSNVRSFRTATGKEKQWGEGTVTRDEVERVFVFCAGATVAEWLACSPPTEANRVQSLAGSPDFRKWESRWTMPLVGGFSLRSPVSPAPSFRRRSVVSTSITPISSQDLAVKSCPNIFTHLLFILENESRRFPPLTLSRTDDEPTCCTRDCCRPTEESWRRKAEGCDPGARSRKTARLPPSKLGPFVILKQISASGLVAAMVWHCTGVSIALKVAVLPACRAGSPQGCVPVDALGGALDRRGRLAGEQLASYLHLLGPASLHHVTQVQHHGHRRLTAAAAAAVRVGHAEAHHSRVDAQLFAALVVSVSAQLHREKVLGKGSAIAFVRNPSKHAAGVISKNHGKPKSGWSDRESNPGRPECESISPFTVPMLAVADFNSHWSLCWLVASPSSNTCHLGSPRTPITPEIQSAEDQELTSPNRRVWRWRYARRHAFVNLRPLLVLQPSPSLARAGWRKGTALGNVRLVISVVVWRLCTRFPTFISGWCVTYLGCGRLWVRIPVDITGRNHVMSIPIQHSTNHVMSISIQHSTNHVMSIPIQHSTNHVMSIPIQHSTNHVMSIPIQPPTNHVMSIPIQPSTNHVMSIPIQPSTNHVMSIPIQHSTNHAMSIPIQHSTNHVMSIPIQPSTNHVMPIPIQHSTNHVMSIPIQHSTNHVMSIPIQPSTNHVMSIPIQHSTNHVMSIPIQPSTNHVMSIPIQPSTNHVMSIPIQHSTNHVMSIPIQHSTNHVMSIPIQPSTNHVMSIPIQPSTNHVMPIPIQHSTNPGGDPR
ncbi:hypothetical protein PR048_031773 [Dryococelus australis]|uniref:Uncharacterized protein n=1 Tax=Dryococelus australis TaxID=614101 RepID=A0ABQ9G674_9NEOP|nr:hypothetical protein PR048_031773 [Dryococelus australis]